MHGRSGPPPRHSFKTKGEGGHLENLAKIFNYDFLGGAQIIYKLFSYKRVKMQILWHMYSSHMCTDILTYQVGQIKPLGNF